MSIDPKRDIVGRVYDETWIDGQGTRHYLRHRALGTGGGPAQWSEDYDCNPICGCSLSAKCGGCNVCMNCDGCYCGEDY